MRGLKIIAWCCMIIGVTCALAWQLLVPGAVEREVRSRLADAGFAHASFAVGQVALDRVELLDVQLAAGLDLGDVDIETGPYQLWRGAHADVVLHAPRIDLAALLAVPAPRSGGASPFRRVVIHDGELVAGDERVAVRGSVDLRGRDPVLDLSMYAPSVQHGATVFDNVAVTARGRVIDLRVCATAHMARTQLDACMQLDARVRAHAAVHLAAKADDGTWSANAVGTVVRHGESFALEDGKLDVTVSEREIGGGTVVRGGIAHADVTGDLATRTFTARGELKAASVVNGRIRLNGARLPFDLAGALRDGLSLRSEQQVVLSATSGVATAFGKALRLETPVVIARGATTLGTTELAAGGDGQMLELVTKLHGVPLDRVLRATTKDRVRATGLLDGELVFTLDAGELALVGGSLAARAPGHLRTASLAGKGDASGIAVQRRIADTLADFRYSQLTLSVGGDADLRLSVRGRGRRVAQAIDVDVNVRGLLAKKRKAK